MLNYIDTVLNKQTIVFTNILTHLVTFQVNQP